MATCWTLLLFFTLLLKTSSQSLDWWQTTVVYELIPRSFKDSNGDGIGDLEGIRQKLPYFKDLGIGTIWIAKGLFSATDFLTIDPIVGTIDEFKVLLREAKALGLRVIVDFAPNQTSEKHLWFQISSNPADPEYERYKDYYVWKPPKENGDPPNNWEPCLYMYPLKAMVALLKHKCSTLNSQNVASTPKSCEIMEVAQRMSRPVDSKLPLNISDWGGSAWEYHEARGEYYLHQSPKTQPDLNFASPSVAQAMKDVLRYWIDIGVDGFKGNTVVYMFEDPTFSDSGSGKPNPLVDQPQTFDMVYQFRDLLDEYANLTGSTKLLYFGAGTDMAKIHLYQRNGTRKGAHFNLNYKVYSIDKSSTAEDFNNSVRAWIDKVGDYASHWVIGASDRHRVANRVGADMVDAMNMLNLLLPGTASAYYGEEIGMEDSTANQQGGPFQWDDSINGGFSTNSTPWVTANPNYVTLNLAAQQAAQRSHWKTFKKLLEARNSPVLQQGSTNINYVTNVWGFIRKYASSAYVVLINPSTTDQSVNVLTIFPNAPSSMEVYAVSLDSAYTEGEVLNSKSIVIHSREAVTLHGSI